jgi:hypothetical protein
MLVGTRTGEPVEGIQFACGTTPGKDHRAVNRNNHDAFAICDGEDYFVGVVADGCGSGAHSEVGAKIGALLCARLLDKHTRWAYPLNLDRFRHDLMWNLEVIAGSMKGPGKLTDIVSDYLLFTLVAIAMNRNTTRLLMFGDGVFSLNGKVQVIESPNNCPAYISYDLLDTGSEAPIAPTVNLEVPTDDVFSFLIGSDGVQDLMAAEGLALPSKPKESVLPLDDLWTNERFYRNSDNLNRYLTLVNKETVRLDRESDVLERHRGHLSDDTTLIVGRTNA